ncbi:hypothetical protein [Dyella sp. RRB7]|uniref:hypothetical protein n=1 Tax=Dyella sp. RRB7 TaxID=2919502 RepID=UPI001FAB321D|nr:hypothetical protein [Dyella sp. RRB7]
MQHLWKKGVVLACALTVTGCASIVGGRYQKVAVDTRAADQSVRADCTLSNGNGSVRVVTPGTAVVHRSAQSLNVTCEKDGKQIAQQAYDANLRGMFWGNLLFGGVIGIVVDLSNGSAQHYPDKLSVMLPSSFALDAPVPAGNSSSPLLPGASTSSGLASLDRRVSQGMFNAAQNVAASHQCNRAIHVLMVDGKRAMFESQCPDTSVVQIECEGESCTAMQPSAS